MVSDMPTISVRVSNEEKKELEEYGSLSNAVREGVKLYLQSKKTSKALAKLRALQAKDRTKTTTLEELKLIREDRNRRSSPTAVSLLRQSSKRMNSSSATE